MAKDCTMGYVVDSSWFRCPSGGCKFHLTDDCETALCSGQPIVFRSGQLWSLLKWARCKRCEKMAEKRKVTTERGGS